MLYRDYFLISWNNVYVNTVFKKVLSLSLKKRRLKHTQKWGYNAMLYFKNITKKVDCRYELRKIKDFICKRKFYWIAEKPYKQIVVDKVAVALYKKCGAS